MTQKIKIQLSQPSILPDLNKKEGQADDFARDFIEIERMKYGHIKQMQAISSEQQTMWAIKTLTGLSDRDIDELYAEDAAEVTKTIFGFVEKYFVLAKKMWQAPAENSVQ